MRIVVDAMGGDFAPAAPVAGALMAKKQFDSDIVLVGREAEIRCELSKLGVEELPAGLEITWTPEYENSWGQHLDFADYVQSDTVLKPITYADETGTFYGALFGMDGRISGLSYALSDERHTNRNDSYGYYLKMHPHARPRKDQCAKCKGGSAA